MNPPLTTEEADRLNKAICLAAYLHAGQYRRESGDPYVTHPLRVMGAVRHRDVNTRIAAVLHDVVEDTGVSLGVIEHQFGPEVRVLVDALTRREGETYRAFIHRVVAGGPEAVAIKTEDVKDNLKTCEQGMLDRYNSALRWLQACDECGALYYHKHRCSHGCGYPVGDLGGGPKYCPARDGRPEEEWNSL